MFDPCIQVKELMSGYPGKWMIAGGWAVDLHIGEKTREHNDIDVAVFMDEQDYLSSILRGWEVQDVWEEHLAPRDLNEPSELPLYEVHAYQQDGMKLKFLFNERIKGRWSFQRDPVMSFSLAHMNLQSEQGIPYLNPEIVLLYKAQNTREKDLEDFQYIFPHLNEHQKEWLKQSLIQYQRHHIWLEKLLY